MFAPSLSLSLSLAFFSSRSLQHKPTQPRVYTTSLSFVIHLPQEVTRAPRQQDTVSFRSPLPLVPRFKRTRSRTLTLTLSFLFNTSHTHTHTHTPRLTYSHVSLARACSRYHLVSSRQHTQMSLHSHTDTSTSPPHTRLSPSVHPNSTRTASSPQHPLPHTQLRSPHPPALSLSSRPSHQRFFPSSFPPHTPSTHTHTPSESLHLPQLCCDLPFRSRAVVASARARVSSLLLHTNAR